MISRDHSANSHNLRKVSEPTVLNYLNQAEALQIAQFI